NVSIEAHDAAGIHSSSELAASTVVVNNMDAFTQLAENLNKNEYEYTTKSGEQTLLLGDRVRLGKDWSDNTYGAYAGDVYEYQGLLAPSVNLGALTADNLNSDMWVRITGEPELSDLFPNFGNLADSNAKAYGGMVVLNDVRGEAESYIDNAIVNAISNITVQAVENASIQADAESRVDASGGSAWGTGTVIALQGTVATNLVNSHAKSFILASGVTTTQAGHVSVTAHNTSKIDSTVHAANTSGDEAKNLLLALNTLGYSSHNMLLDTVEALLSKVLGVEEALPATAYIQDSVITAAGSASVEASNQAQLNATVSNAANSAASALFNASGSSMGAAIALNRVAGGAKAYLNDSLNNDAVSTSVTAGGALRVKADDAAQLFSNVKLVSSSITTNDGGAAILGETVNDFVPADYSTAESRDELGKVVLRDLKFGDRVRLTDDYAGGGDPGGVYEYMGTDADGEGMDLGSQDYSDLGWWKKVPETELIPQGNNLTASDSNSLGGVVVLNHLKSEAEAFIEDVTATGASVTVQAIENAGLHATADAFLESSGGSVFGEGDSTAKGGTVSANMVISGAEARLLNSVVTATAGDVTVDAQQTSTLDATTLATVSSAGDTIGVVVAVNMLGWSAPNFLFETLDALLGEPSENIFGLHPSQAKAFITDSDVTAAGGGVSATANNAARINAHVSNESTAISSAFYGAKATTCAGVAAFNKVSSDAQAFIRDRDGSDERHQVLADGAVTVRAEDNASIQAETAMGSTTKKSNDAGTGLLNNFINTLLYEYQYTSRSGERNLEFGDKVRVAEGYTKHDYTTDDGVQNLTAGDQVMLAEGYEGGGSAKAVYRYIGEDAEVDLSSANYSDAAKWRQMDGRLYEYMGTSNLVDLGSADYSDYELWKAITEENLLPKAVIGA
ncbi:MAG: hypothetical protein ACP5I1_12400, partial [Candidatus Hinthialibacter sp.]